MSTKAQRTIQAWERGGDDSPIAARIGAKRNRPRKADHGHTVVYSEVFRDKTDFTRAHRFTCQCGKVFTGSDRGAIRRRVVRHSKTAN